jgi:steroid 5-alpha reductase family enzyme
MIPLAVVHLAFALAAVFAVWGLQLRTRNAGVIDAAWTFIIGAG